MSGGDMSHTTRHTLLVASTSIQRRTWNCLATPSREALPLYHLSCWRHLLQWLPTVDQNNTSTPLSACKVFRAGPDLCFSSGNPSCLSANSLSSFSRGSSKPSCIFSCFPTLNSHPWDASTRLPLLLSACYIRPCLHVHTHWHINKVAFISPCSAHNRWYLYSI